MRIRLAKPEDREAITQIASQVGFYNFQIVYVALLTLNNLNPTDRLFLSWDQLPRKLLRSYRPPVEWDQIHEVAEEHGPGDYRLLVVDNQGHHLHSRVFQVKE